MTGRLTIATGLVVMLLAGRAHAAGAAIAATPASGAASASALDMNTRAMQALSWGDFDELARLQVEARQSAERTADGLPQMAAYMSGLSTLWNIGSPEATDAYFANLDAVTAGWVQAHPRSALALALRMRALHARAWFYRGGGYAHTVAPQQYALFQRYIEQAMEVAQGAHIDGDDAMSQIYLVMIGRSSNLDWATQRALAAPTLDRHPDEFGLWEELFFSADPKWGGSWELVGRMVQDAAKRQKTPEDGDMMYARLWILASSELLGEFFDTPVDWIRLRRGLRDIVTRYPQTGLVNNFAQLACLRRDRAAAQDMMSRLGDEPDLERWGWGNQARSAFDECRRWLREPAALPAAQPAPQPLGIEGGSQS